MPYADELNLNLQGVVHDLNNVFQAIQDAADLLDGPALQTVAGSIHRSVEHGQRLVRSLVGTQSSTSLLEYTAQSAIQFATDLLEATHRPPVRFTCDVPADLNVRGNPVDWERVLVNLLLNSTQAMAAGGAVHISASAGDTETHISVADNGPGIPPGILERIFEPHFSTKKANSGLGLHIVRSLVERYGGSVSAVNAVGGGAEFRIVVPMSAVELGEEV